MAKNKIGFVYYAVETDRYQDIKIKKLKKNFGGFGVAIYDYILCEIYRVKGCFIEWDESIAFDVADYWEVKESLVTEIVNYCCNVGLFNKALFASERVLSGKSIVDRYIDWSKKAKRTTPEIPEKIKIILEKPDIIPEEMPKLPEDCPKVKESKVKESKVKESKVTAFAIVASDETTRLQQQLKTEYKGILTTVLGKKTLDIWIAIRDFIVTKQPEFIDPYIDLWNLFASKHKLASVIASSDGRRTKFKTRISEPAFNFIQVLEGIKISSHLKGDNDRGWKASFDWIMENGQNYLKIIEGNYR